jgi:hypothetical protein
MLFYIPQVVLATKYPGKKCFVYEFRGEVLHLSLHHEFGQQNSNQYLWKYVRRFHPEPNGRGRLPLSRDLAVNILKKPKYPRRNVRSSLQKPRMLSNVAQCLQLGYSFEYGNDCPGSIKKGISWLAERLKA